MKAPFTEDADLDAKLVAAGMKGGLEAIMETAFLLRNRISAEDVVARCEWLKTQPQEYIDKVVKLVNQNT